MSMRQRGIKNVNKNDRSGPEVSNTTHSGLRWMKSRKSGNLALLMKQQPKHYSSLKRPQTFKLSGLHLLCACVITFCPPWGTNLDRNNESSFVHLSIHQTITHSSFTEPEGMMHVISLFWHFLNYTYWFEGWDREARWIQCYRVITSGKTLKNIHTLQIVIKQAYFLVPIVSVTVENI